MKKKVLVILSLIIVLVCSILLSACGDKGKDPIEQGYNPTGEPITVNNFWEKVSGEDAKFAFDLIISQSAGNFQTEYKINGIMTNGKCKYTMKTTVTGISNFPDVNIYIDNMSNYGGEDFYHYSLILAGDYIKIQKPSEVLNKIFVIEAIVNEKYSYVFGDNIINLMPNDAALPDAYISMTGADAAQCTYSVAGGGAVLKFYKIGTATFTPPTNLIKG